MPDPIETPHRDTPSQAAQAAEATARLTDKNAPFPGERAEALDVSGGDAPAPLRTPDQQTPPQERPPPPARSRADEMRNEITKRFREGRQTITAEQTDQLSDFIQNPVPPEMVEATQEQPEPPAAPAPIAEKQMVRIKVRGEERDVSLEEALAMAQKSYAAEDYLDEAKSRLKSVEQLEVDMRNRAQRVAPADTHPVGQNGQHPDGSNAQPGQDSTAATPQHPETMQSFLDAVRYGEDPEEAERLLNERIATTADRLVQQRLIDQRLADEGARAGKVLKDFIEKHPELAKDKKARAVIEVTTLELQEEDLKAIGLDPNKLRPDGQPSTPGDIATAHRYYRAMGMQVRSPEQLLGKAIEEATAWRGVKGEPKPADNTPSPAQPTRVEVSVERQERRQSVQPQPSRTQTPAPVPPPAAPRDRSAIIEQMKAQRAHMRGTVLGAS
jgi:hypothetical protein